MKLYQYVTTAEAFQKTFESLKSTNPSLNVEKFAQRLELGTSTLKMILSGKRKPNVHQVLSLARGLRLSPDGTSYLETMALMENAKNNWEKAYYSKMLPKKKKMIKLSTVTTSQQELLADPIIIPILVYIMEQGDSQINCSFLAKALNTKKELIEKLIAQLQTQEIIKKHNDGKFHVVFDKFSHRLVQQKYQKQLLVEASKRIDSEYESATSLFLSYAFSTTDESLIQLQMDLKTLMEKYMENSSIDNKQTKIAQACFQVFPVISI